MRLFFTFIIFFLLILGCQDSSKKEEAESKNVNDPEKEEWVDLFNGSDLSDWKIKITNHQLGENFKNTFRAEDNMIKAVYKEYDTFNNNFGHLYYKKPFSYYRLKLDYRFKGQQVKGGPQWALKNSGVMLHSQAPETQGLGQSFPMSVEFQFLDGLDDQQRPTGNLCTPGTAITLNDSINYQHCIDSSSESYSGEEWVSIEAVVLGDERIIHIVENDTVLEYTNIIIGGGVINRDANEEWKSFGIESADEWLAMDGMPLKEGYIALQAESSPVDFKNIQLLDLCGCMDKSAKNYKSYYVKADNSQCVY